MSDNMDRPFDEDEPTALATTKANGQITEEGREFRVLTPQQAKDRAIADVTHSAYARAGELKLTAEENAALGAEFPDEAFRAGAGGDERLIYIEHAALRDRLNNVLGRGAWSLITRSQWTEEYQTRKGDRAVRVYAQVMLVVRGCYVAEAVGDMTYYPHNDKTTYSDAMRGSVTAAFRRCAADFGVGVQAWSKNWCEGWWKRKTSPQKPQTPANGPTSPAKASNSVDAVRAEATVQKAAMEGTDALRAAWQGLTKEQRSAVGTAKLEHYKKIAAGIDDSHRGDAYEGDPSEGIN